MESIATILSLWSSNVDTNKKLDRKTNLSMVQSTTFNAIYIISSSMAESPIFADLVQNIQHKCNVSNSLAISNSSNIPWFLNCLTYSKPHAKYFQTTSLNQRSCHHLPSVFWMNGKRSNKLEILTKQYFYNSSRAIKARTSTALV